MVSRLENFKFLNYNNGPRLGGGGGGSNEFIYSSPSVRKKFKTHLVLLYFYITIWNKTAFDAKNNENFPQKIFFRRSPRGGIAPKFFPGGGVFGLYPLPCPPLITTKLLQIAYIKFNVK